jgi:hypothetical protein
MRIRTGLTPLRTRRDLAETAAHIEMSRKSAKLASRKYSTAKLGNGLCGEPVRPSSALNLSVAFGGSDANARTVP